MHGDERGDERTVGRSDGEGKHVAHEILGGKDPGVVANDDGLAMITDGGVGIDGADDAKTTAFLREGATERPALNDRSGGCGCWGCCR